MTRNNLQKGLCPKNDCEGFLQVDKEAHIVYCLCCHWRIDLDDYQAELDNVKEDYKFRDYNDNLKDLNSL